MKPWFRSLLQDISERILSVEAKSDDLCYRQEVLALKNGFRLRLPPRIWWVEAGFSAGRPTVDRVPRNDLQDI